MCFLLGIHSVDELNIHFAKGSVFENLTITELVKNNMNNATKAKFYFWRDTSQNEVDVIVESGLNMTAVELKSGKTIYPNFFKGLDYFKKINSSAKSILIYGGVENQERTNYTVHSVYELPNF